MTFLGALSRVKDDDTAWEEVIACLDLSKVDKDRANLLAAQLLDVLRAMHSGHRSTAATFHRWLIVAVI